MRHATCGRSLSLHGVTWCCHPPDCKASQAARGRWGGNGPMATQPRFRSRCCLAKCFRRALLELVWREEKGGPDLPVCRHSLSGAGGCPLHGAGAGSQLARALLKSPHFPSIYLNGGSKMSTHEEVRRRPGFGGPAFVSFVVEVPPATC